jgi:hypothetical protein
MPYCGDSAGYCCCLDSLAFLGELRLGRSLSGDLKMNQPAKAQEPSMEEILASIRRIIADDEATKAPPKAPDPMPPPPTPMADAPRPATLPPRAAPPPPPRPAAAAAAVRSMPAPAAEPAMRQDEIDAMLMGVQTAAPPAPERTAPEVFDLTEAMAASASVHTEGFRAIDGNPDIVFEEPATDAAPAPEAEPSRQAPAFDDQALVSSATSAMVDSAFNTLAQTVLVQNARTLEDLVREMLRPLLKTWLDDNLPGMVERLVRAEIERVSRGR